MLRNQTGAHSPSQPWLCTNFKDTFASTELPSFCHQQKNFYKSSGSNLTSLQAPKVTAILLLSYQHLPTVEWKSFLRTLSSVRNCFPEAGISTCHISSALKHHWLHRWEITAQHARSLNWRNCSLQKQLQELTLSIKWKVFLRSPLALWTESRAQWAQFAVPWL